MKEDTPTKAQCLDINRCNWYCWAVRHSIRYTNPCLRPSDMQVFKDSKSSSTHWLVTHREAGWGLSLLPSYLICQGSIETHAMTNIIIILRSGKTGSAWKHNTALNLPRNQQTSVASFTRLAEGHRLPLEMEGGELHPIELNWLVIHLNWPASFKPKDVLLWTWRDDSFHIKSSTSATTRLQWTRQLLMMFASTPLEPLFTCSSVHLQVVVSATNRSHRVQSAAKTVYKKNKKDMTANALIFGN